MVMESGLETGDGDGDGDRNGDGSWRWSMEMGVGMRKCEHLNGKSVVVEIGYRNESLRRRMIVICE